MDTLFFALSTVGQAIVEGAAQDDAQTIPLQRTQFVDTGLFDRFQLETAAALAHPQLHLPASSSVRCAIHTSIFGNSARTATGKKDKNYQQSTQILAYRPDATPGFLISRCL
jgi:hypothetical protein